MATQQHLLRPELESPRGSSLAGSLNVGTVSSHTLTEQETGSLSSWQVISHPGFPSSDLASPCQQNPQPRLQRHRSQDASSSSLQTTGTASPKRGPARPGPYAPAVPKAPALPWSCSSHETLSCKSDVEDDDDAEGSAGRGWLPRDSMELDAVLKQELGALSVPAAYEAAAIVFGLAAAASVASGGSAAGSVFSADVRSAGKAPTPLAASPAAAAAAAAASSASLKAATQHPATAPPTSHKGIQQETSVMMSLEHFLDENVPAFPFRQLGKAAVWQRAS